MKPLMDSFESEALILRILIVILVIWVWTQADKIERYEAELGYEPRPESHYEPTR